MTLTGLLRIFCRWRRAGCAVLALSMAGGLAVALVKPLWYEAQVTIERKPPKISAQPSTPEFDVTRFTSENQRTLTMLKSRYFLLQWLRAIGPEPATPKALENQLKKLELHLSVKPVNFTDLYLIKVQAVDPEEARRRTGVFTTLFETWDTAQVRAEAQELTALLKKRLETVRTELSDQRDRSKRFKLKGTLSLSGSMPVSEIEGDIKAKQDLYTDLTGELERAEREIDQVSVHRVRVAIPVTASTKPVVSRAVFLWVAVLLSLFLTSSIVLILEWQAGCVYRVGDIYKAIGAQRVLTVPISAGEGVDTKEARPIFQPLFEAMDHFIRLSGAVVVQTIFVSDREGKGLLVDCLQRLALDRLWHPCVISSQDDGTLNVDPPLTGDRESIVRGAESDRSLGSILDNLRKDHNAVFLNLNPPPGGAPGSNLSESADIFCFILTSAQTSIVRLRLLDQRLKRSTRQKSFFVLTRWHDPLPHFLRTR